MPRATFASPFLVTIHDVAAELMGAAGAPPQALDPLMTRTIENGFEHTGPLVRDDRDDRRAARRRDRRPPSSAPPLYRALAETRPPSSERGHHEDPANRRGGAGALPRDGVGLVPTMGALHAGHVALFEAARRECDPVVASIFVNPAQFGDGEDFERYPRDEEADAAIAEKAGVDFLFVPSVDEMYPDGFQTWVDVEEISDGLEGDARPGHFRGVATVCLKLFNIVRPKRAYFGQKDAQQAAVLEQLVADLNLDSRSASFRRFAT